MKMKSTHEKEGNTYFKNKNMELERRIEQLLMINTELKQQL